MTKDAAISVRVDARFKAFLEQKAREEGRTLAAYVDRILQLLLQPPNWVLRDAQPINRRQGGPTVVLPIAEGWPSAGMSADQAEALGNQLIGAAQLARKIPPTE
ncbi:MAG: hypothetical protein WBW81_05595 [Methylocella sp.]